MAAPRAVSPPDARPEIRSASTAYVTARCVTADARGMRAPRGSGAETNEGATARLLARKQQRTRDVQFYFLCSLSRGRVASRTPPARRARTAAAMDKKDIDWDKPAITDVKMVHKGSWGPEGTLIPISISDHEKKSSIRRKVAAASGIPYEHVKLILVGIAQIGAGDRRSNIKYGNCGVAEGIGLTFSTAAAGNKPHQPRATGNRVDNRGNWTQID